MHKFKLLRSKPTDGLGAELEDLARAATKKTLSAPDDELNQQVLPTRLGAQLLSCPRSMCPHPKPRRCCALD